MSRNPYSSSTLALVLTGALALFGSRAADAANALTPSAAVQTACGVSGASQYWTTSAGDDARFANNDGLVNLAASLGYSPAKIYQWVYDNVDFDVSWGSFQGAQTTLKSRLGNSVDQSSLLLAMLRASGYPARYANAMAQFDMFNDPRLWYWVKTDSVNGAWGLLTGSYPISAGGASTQRLPGIAQVPSSNYLKLPMMWVEVCVPYTNYRGSASDTTGYRWVPMVPAFKLHRPYGERIAHGQVFEELADSINQGITGSTGNSSPVAEFERKVQNWLNGQASYNSKSVADVDLKWERLPLTSEVLPVALPFDLQTAVTRSATLSDELRMYLKLTLSGPDASGNPTVQYTWSGSSAGISEKRIALTFEGTTAAHQTTLDGYRSAQSVPSTCTSVAVKPALRVDGVVQTLAGGTNSHALCRNPAAGTYALNGFDFRLDLQRGVAAPALVQAIRVTGAQLLDQRTMAYAVGQASDRVLADRAAKLLAEVKARTSGSYALADIDATQGELLHYLGLKYMQAVEDTTRRVGRLFNVSAGGGVTMGQVTVSYKPTYVAGLPFAIEGRRLFVDFPGGQYLSGGHRNTGASPANQMDFRLSGLESSALESFMPGEVALRDAVSTTRGLKFAKQGGVAISTLTSAADVDNAALITKAPTANGYDANAVNYLKSFFSGLPAGYTRKVYAPKTVTSYGQWTGVVALGLLTNSSGVTTNATYGIAQSNGTPYNGGYQATPALSANYYTNNSLIGGSALSTGYQPSTPTTTGSLNLGASATAAFQRAVTPAGFENWTAYDYKHVGDPVDAASGALNETFSDLRIKGVGGLDFNLTRYYNSLPTGQMGPMGWGWTHSYHSYLVFLSQSFPNATCPSTGCDNTVDTTTRSLLWVDAGRAVRVSVTGTSAGGGVPTSATFVAPANVRFAVSRPTATTYVIRDLRTGQKLTYTDGINGATSFNGKPGQAAMLTRIEDVNGNYLNLAYQAGTMRLSTVTDRLGRTLTFTLNANDHVTQVQDWTGRKWQYGYGGADGKQLVSYKSPLAVAEGLSADATYTYFAASDGGARANLLKTIATAGGGAMSFEYYHNGQAFRQTDGVGQTLTFLYSPVFRQTRVIDQLGRATTYTFDAKGQVVRESLPDGSDMRYQYAANNPANRTQVIPTLGTGTAYAFDGTANAGPNLTRITDPNGAYEAYSEFTTCTAAAGVCGKVGKTRERNGNYVLRKFDASGRLTDLIRLKASVTDANIATVAPTAAAFNPQTGAANVESWVRTTYDAYGNVKTVTRMRDLANAAGATVTYNYSAAAGDAGLNLTSVARSLIRNNGTTVVNETSPTLVYDNLGRETTGINDAWYSVGSRWDKNDRKIGTRLGTRPWTDLAYDRDGRRLGVALRDGAAMLSFEMQQYDAVGRVTASYDALGRKTTTLYGEDGNVSKIVDPVGREISYRYDLANRQAWLTDAGGRTAVERHDIAGRPVLTIDASGNQVARSYHGDSALGQLKSVVVTPGGSTARTVTLAYDTIGRLNKVTDTAGNTSLTTYDGLGRRYRVIGPVYTDGTSASQRRPVTRYAYDAWGRTASVSQGYTTFTTDAQAVTDTADSVVVQQSYVYNEADQVVQVKDGAGTVVLSNSYDQHGNLATRTDALGNLATYAYDANTGTLTSVTTTRSGQTTHTLSHTYDNLGRIKTESVKLGTAAATTLTYTYNTLGQVSEIADSRLAAGKTYRYFYTASGLLDRVTDPENETTRYVHDGEDRLVAIAAPGRAEVNLVYDAAGRVIERRAGPLLMTTSYNADGSIASVRHHGSAGLAAPLATYAYTYDSRGLLQQAVEGGSALTARTRNYTYDSMARLLTVADAAKTLETYTYDAYGNRATLIDNSGTSAVTYSYNYTANKQNRLADIRVGSFTSTTFHRAFEYDANGNLVRKCNVSPCTSATAASNQLYALGYNVTGQLTSLVAPAASASYAYGPKGARIQRTAAGVVENFVHADGLFLSEYNASFVRSAQNVLGGLDLPLVRRVGTTNSYYAQDQLGSVTDVLSAAGASTANGSFEAFGKAVPRTGTLPRFGYAGREPEGSDLGGLIYYRARYYDPELGRFTSLDPTGMADGVNQYTYVRNSPLRFVDPFGTSSTGAQAGYNWRQDLNSWANNSSAISNAGSLASGMQYGFYKGFTSEANALARSNLDIAFSHAQTAGQVFNALPDRLLPSSGSMFGLSDRHLPGYGFSQNGITGALGTQVAPIAALQNTTGHATAYAVGGAAFGLNLAGNLIDSAKMVNGMVSDYDHYQQTGNISLSHTGSAALDVGLGRAQDFVGSHAGAAVGAGLGLGAWGVVGGAALGSAAIGAAVPAIQENLRNMDRPCANYSGSQRNMCLMSVGY